MMDFTRGLERLERERILSAGAPVMPNDGLVLAINGGSSTIRYAAFRAGDSPERVVSGKVERVADGAAAELIEQLGREMDLSAVTAVGHRVVHGLKRTEPALVTEALVAELHGIVAYDPEHLPRELELIEAFTRRFPDLPQVVCFDTAFHAKMPRVAKMLPIPRRFESEGLQRYGFHGLSYSFLIEELGRVAGADVANGRVILAHLGNGASLCAVRGGESVDTTMAFTPAAGIPMGTRSGDLDPGVAWYLMSLGGLTPDMFSRMINHESGLLGVSETSSDMRDLLSKQAGDVRAAEAVDLFCYEVRKRIGAFAAALGGLDTLVFAGGIGENNPEVRARICARLEFLGIELDEAANVANAGLLSRAGGRVAVRVIPTNEELMIARLVRRFLTKNSGS